MAPRLYDICLRRLTWFLREKHRDEFPNPFSDIPSRIIHDLIACVLGLYAAGGFRSHFLEPLLMSGQVKHLALRDIRLEDELLSTLRSFTVCRGLRSLSLLNICEFNLDIVSRLLEELLKALKNLEDLHCSVLFGLAALRKCQKLRTVRLHFLPESSLDDFLEEEEDSEHDSLQLFTLCGQRAERFVYFEEVAQLLLRCPNLRSLGYLDVSAAIGHLQGERPRTYNLESCCWRELPSDRAQVPFISSIRAAALACPRLKEIVVKIPHRHYDDTLSVLSTLKNLTYLEIEMDYPNREFKPAVSDLLQEIGSRLQHLALHRIDHIELDVLLRSCPQLVSLKVDCDHLAYEWTDAPANLRRLTFFSYDGSSENKALRMLLSKCTNLQELFLKNPQFLSDTFLSRVLRENPRALARLRLACICDCCLTTDGLTKFVNSAEELEKICVESSKISEEDAENLIRKLNPAAKLISDYSEGIWDEFFYRRKYFCA